MAHVRTVVVQAGGKRSANYQSNEVSVMATIDLHDDDPFTAIAQWQDTLQHHVDTALAAWEIPVQAQSKPNGNRPEPVPSSGRMPYDEA